MAYRFNPPPNWPLDEPGWTPPPGWQPDPSWGPAPDGWNFWVDEAAEQASSAPAPTAAADDATRVVSTDESPLQDSTHVASTGDVPVDDATRVGHTDESALDDPTHVASTDETPLGAQGHDELDATRVVGTQENSPSTHDAAPAPTYGADPEAPAAPEAPRGTHRVDHPPVAAAGDLGTPVDGSVSPDVPATQQDVAPEGVPTGPSADDSTQAPSATGAPAGQDSASIPEVSEQRVAPALGDPALDAAGASSVGDHERSASPDSTQPYAVDGQDPGTGQPVPDAHGHASADIAPAQPGYGQASPDGYGQGSADAQPVYGQTSPDGHGQPAAGAQAAPAAYGQVSPNTYGQSSPNGYGQASPNGYGQPSANSYAQASPNGYGQPSANSGDAAAAYGTGSADTAWQTGGNGPQGPKKGIVARFWWVGCIVLFLVVALIIGIGAVILLNTGGDTEGRQTDPATTSSSPEEGTTASGGTPTESSPTEEETTEEGTLSPVTPTIDPNALTQPFVSRDGKGSFQVELKWVPSDQIPSAYRDGQSIEAPDSGIPEYLVAVVHVKVDEGELSANPNSFNVLTPYGGEIGYSSRTYSIKDGGTIDNERGFTFTAGDDYTYMMVYDLPRNPGLKFRYADYSGNSLDWDVPA